MSSNDSSRRDHERESVYSDNGGVISRKILVLAKAAPIPSTKYRETVCTAGVDESGNWFRLYPIPFRYLNYWNKFATYQWITVEMSKVESAHDNRKESFRPDLGTLTLGSIVTTGKGSLWSERKSILLPLCNPSIEYLETKFYEDGTSLGIVKPHAVEFVVEKSDESWSQRQEQMLHQQRLFEPQPKELQKTPFKFSYKFLCTEPSCRGHKLSIQEWQIYALYYNLKNKYSYAEDQILEKIKQKYLTQMFDSSRDTHLIVGTVHSRYKRPIFVVIGVFWPPK